MDTLLIYLFAMTITPGPNTILSMANAAAVGLRKGIWLNIGMLVGLTAVTAIAYIASASLYALIPSIEPWLKAIGAAYLVYLAYRTYRKGSIETEEKSAGFAEGMILQLINVKVHILALTAISTMIIPAYEGTAIRIAISMLIPLACFAGGLVYPVYSYTLFTVKIIAFKPLRKAFGDRRNKKGIRASVKIGDGNILPFKVNPGPGRIAHVHSKREIGRPA